MRGCGAGAGALDEVAESPPAGAGIGAGIETDRKARHWVRLSRSTMALAPIGGEVGETRNTPSSERSTVYRKTCQSTSS
jgi:hypothetical protein